MMIQSIRPSAREAYDRSWELEKDEENEFLERLNRTSRKRRKEDRAQSHHAITFENPLFNPISGNTNYILVNLASNDEQKLLS